MTPLPTTRFPPSPIGIAPPFVAVFSFPTCPVVPKLDLRVEGVYTDLPAGGALSHGFFYFNTRYLNGYTNQGQLLASWIGREGQGAQGWANYWFSARNRLQFNYRHQKVSQQFIPGRGHPD